MRSSFYACVLPVRPVRAFKAVLLEDRLKSFYGCSYRLNRFLFFVHTAKKKSTNAREKNTGREWLAQVGKMRG